MLDLLWIFLGKTVVITTVLYSLALLGGCSLWVFKSRSIPSFVACFGAGAMVFSKWLHFKNNPVQSILIGDGVHKPAHDQSILEFFLMFYGFDIGLLVVFLSLLFYFYRESVNKLV